MVKIWSEFFTSKTLIVQCPLFRWSEFKSKPRQEYRLCRRMLVTIFFCDECPYQLQKLSPRSKGVRNLRPTSTSKNKNMIPMSSSTVTSSLWIQRSFIRPSVIFLGLNEWSSSVKRRPLNGSVSPNFELGDWINIISRIAAIASTNDKNRIRKWNSRIQTNTWENSLQKSQKIYLLGCEGPVG